MTFSHHTEILKTECLLSLEYSSYFQNAVAVSIENWTNQKLEFPALTQEEGRTDRWWKPQDIPKHTRLSL